MQVTVSHQTVLPDTEGVNYHPLLTSRVQVLSERKSTLKIRNDDPRISGAMWAVCCGLCVVGCALLAVCSTCVCDVCVQHMVRGEPIIRERVDTRLKEDNRVHTPSVMVDRETGMSVNMCSVCALWCVKCVLHECCC
jgi:hypothetical protein